MGFRILPPVCVLPLNVNFTVFTCVFSLGYLVPVVAHNRDCFHILPPKVAISIVCCSKNYATKSATPLTNCEVSEKV